MRIAFFGDSLTSGVPGSSYFAILRERFPTCTLVNYGKGNDTVVSLHRRISRSRFAEPFDLAFLWIGVNDVPRSSRWPYRVSSTLIGQRRARDLGEFRATYVSTLDKIRVSSRRVIAAPPVLRGENLENRWNRRLTLVAGLIEDVTAGREWVEFLDLRAAFAQELATRSVSDYARTTPFGVLLDALTLRTDELVDAKAAERGLHLTLDGLHLNSSGARLVAREFAKTTEEHRSASAQGEGQGSRIAMKAGR